MYVLLGVCTEFWCADAGKDAQPTACVAACRDRQTDRHKTQHTSTRAPPARTSPSLCPLCPLPVCSLKELVRRVHEQRALELTERLCDKVLSTAKKDTNARDVARWVAGWVC